MLLHLVDCRLKVPQNQVEFISSNDESSGVLLVDVECGFKKTGEDDQGTSNLDVQHDK